MMTRAPALLLALAATGCAARTPRPAEHAWPQPDPAVVRDLSPAVLASPGGAPDGVTERIARYRAVSRDDYRARRQALGAVVELEHTEALSLLVEVAWTDLPPLMGHDDDEQEVRSREEEIQYLAVLGMARLRRLDGRLCDSSLAALRRVAQGHPSFHLQVAARDQWHGLQTRGLVMQP